MATQLPWPEAWQPPEQRRTSTWLGDTRWMSVLLGHGTAITLSRGTQAASPRSEARTCCWEQALDPTYTAAAGPGAGVEADI